MFNNDSERSNAGRVFQYEADPETNFLTSQFKTSQKQDEASTINQSITQPTVMTASPWLATVDRRFFPVSPAVPS